MLYLGFFCASIGKMCLKELEKPIRSYFFESGNAKNFSIWMKLASSLYAISAWERFHRNAVLSENRETSLNRKEHSHLIPDFCTLLIEEWPHIYTGVDLKKILHSANLYANLTTCHHPAGNTNDPSVGYSTVLWKWLLLYIRNDVRPISEYVRSIPHFLSRIFPGETPYCGGSMMMA